MRPIGLMMAAALIASTAAAAAWKEYPQPQLGFVVEFPADPAVSSGNYRTGLVPSATAHIYSVKEDHALYVATVVDLPDRKEEGAAKIRQSDKSTSLHVPSFFRSYEIDIPGINIFRVRDGLIVSCRNYWDGIEALDQLG